MLLVCWGKAAGWGASLQRIAGMVSIAAVVHPADELGEVDLWSGGAM